MKAGKIILALVLAGAAFAAYYYFPDPLGDQVAAAQKAAAGKPAGDATGNVAESAAGNAAEAQATPAPPPPTAQ